jgi:hypothetical protein
MKIFNGRVGEFGRPAGLRIQCSKQACEFESHPGHQKSFVIRKDKSSFGLLTAVLKTVDPKRVLGFETPSFRQV